MVRRVGTYELLRQVAEEARVLVFEAQCDHGHPARSLALAAGDRDCSVRPAVLSLTSKTAVHLTTFCNLLTTI